MLLVLLLVFIFLKANMLMIFYLEPTCDDLMKIFSELHGNKVASNKHTLSEL